MSFAQIKNTAERIEIGKVLCVGRNYAEHAKELNSEIPAAPVFFLKPASAVIHDGETIIRPKPSSDLHYESEIVLLMDKGGKAIDKSKATSCILGYGIGLDMTLRDIQNELKNKKLPWFISKGFDTSAPISEFITAKEIPQSADMAFTCKVNGAIRQSSSASKMLFNFAALISYISNFVAIERGDLIFTGTPEGVGSVQEGDLIEAELTGLVKTSHRVAFS